MNMETKAAKTVDPQAELDERYARFGLRPLSESDVWTLSMATMVMPDGNPGAEAYLAQVAGVDCFAGRLALWGRVVACGISSARYKARNGQRRRTYVEGYDDAWGRYAVADGLTLALYGWHTDSTGKAAANHQGYIRVRDFVGGALVDAIAEFRVALEWAAGYRRDRVLEGRWEGITGLNYRDAKSDATIGRETSNSYPMFAPGCGVTPKAPDLDYYDRVSGIARTPHSPIRGESESPETLYPGLRPSDWWDEAEARRMRKAPVTMIVSPPPRN